MPPFNGFMARGGEAPPAWGTIPNISASLRRKPDSRPTAQPVPPMSALTFLLIRHGQTEWNTQRRVLGRTDIGLDETGLVQAADLPERIGQIDALWSSPLLRAKQTAEPLARRSGLTVGLAPGLMEMDQGLLEGLGETELLERFGEFAAAWRNDPAGLRLPEGETMDEVADRARAALDEIAAASGNGRIAIITHQIVLSATICRILGEPLARWRHHTHPNTAWSEIAWGQSPAVLTTKRLR